MNNELHKTVDAINLYTFGMDKRNWSLAVSKFSDTVDVDYSAVGAPKGIMTRGELQHFLQHLLGKDELRVHTAVSQVLVNPSDPTELIAYYSVRH